MCTGGRPQDGVQRAIIWLMASPPPPPRNGRPFATPSLGLADIACLGPIVAYAIYGLLGTAATPSLVGTHPLLLEALRGATVGIVSAAAFAHEGKYALLLVLLAPIPALMASDPFMYWAGHRYGHAVLVGPKASPRRQAQLAKMEGLFARFGLLTIVFAYFLPLPSSLFYLAAGETGIPFWQFIIADLIGTIAWVGTLASLGWILGANAVTAATDVSKAALPITVIIIVIILTWAVVNEIRTHPPAD